MKRYSVRDGMGVAVLRKEGIETGIISGEHSPSLLRRAEKLRITLCRLGVADKKVELATVLAIAQLNPEQIAYIGDDINDLGIIDTIRSYGLTGAPADAMPIVKRSVHFIASVQGGHGAFRDFAEWIISLRNGHKEHTAYQPVLSPYAQELI
jgi:3-deoxy-D-manno-octulosonate 8-phosphate phosphatase (KDO 8-P phosphatase)